MYSFIFIWVTQSVALISPGAAVVAIASTAMSKTRQAALSMALGVAFGSAFWAVLGLWGMASLLERHPLAFQFMQFLGAGYFAYLAFKAFRNLKGQIHLENASPSKDSKDFLAGFFIQISNPKAILFWLSIGSGAFNTPPSHFILVMACLLAFANSFFINALYAILFSSRTMVKAYEAHQFAFRLMFGLIFALISLMMLSSLIMA